MKKRGLKQCFIFLILGYCLKRFQYFFLYCCLFTFLDEAFCLPPWFLVSRRCSHLRFLFIVSPKSGWQGSDRIYAVLLHSYSRPAAGSHLSFILCPLSGARKSKSGAKREAPEWSWREVCFIVTLKLKLELSCMKVFTTKWSNLYLVVWLSILEQQQEQSSWYRQQIWHWSIQIQHGLKLQCRWVAKQLAECSYHGQDLTLWCAWVNTNRLKVVQTVPLDKLRHDILDNGIYWIKIFHISNWFFSCAHIFILVMTIFLFKKTDYIKKQTRCWVTLSVHSDLIVRDIPMFQMESLWNYKKNNYLKTSKAPYVFFILLISIIVEHFQIPFIFKCIFLLPVGIIGLVDYSDYWLLIWRLIPHYSYKRLLNTDQHYWSNFTSLY